MDIPRNLFEILVAVVNAYEATGRPVTSSEIAEAVGKSDGTVRNVISALKAMGLVEAKTGPGGGYVPTVKGVEAVKGSLALDKLWEPQRLVVDGRVSRLYVVELDLLALSGPGAKAVLKVAGSMHQVRRGSQVILGPTGGTRLIIHGRVQDVNPARRELLVEVDSMVAVPRLRARDVMTPRPERATRGMSMREVARLIVSRNIRALPVVDEEGVLEGLVSAQHVSKAYADGRLDARVEDYMDRDVTTVEPDEDILRIMRTMVERNAGRVVVVDQSGRPQGIITRTDILMALTRLYEVADSFAVQELGD